MYPYITYCSHQAEAAETLEKLKKVNPELREFLAQDLPSWRGLQLEDYLVKPFQRLTRYPLLVREMMKVTPKNTVHYQELQEAAEIFQRLTKASNEIVRQKAEEQMQLQVASMIEENPSCTSYFNTNMPIIMSLASNSLTINPEYTHPKVIHHFPISYRKDESVPHHGHCILYENCIFLLHEKSGHYHPIDLIPLISLEMFDQNGKNLLVDYFVNETETTKSSIQSQQQQGTFQDDKEISYLVSKFIRFERLFFDEICAAKQAMAPLLDNPTTSESGQAIARKLVTLLQQFLTGLDEAEHLLLSTPTAEIKWMDIYYIFMELMPHFEELGNVILSNLPSCYKQEAFTESFTEKDFIQILQRIFNIVDHTPAYVRSAHRILQRIPDDPNLSVLLGTYRMIETSVRSMKKLRFQFDANFEVLAIASRILEQNIFTPDRSLVYFSTIEDFSYHQRVCCYLFNDLLITCVPSGTMYDLCTSISLARDPKQTLVAIPMTPTTFQILQQETGEPLLTLKTDTEAECSTWMGYIQSVIEANSGPTTKVHSAPVKKSVIRITGSSSTIWSLCFSNDREANFLVKTVLAVYESFMGGVCSTIVREKRDAEDLKDVIPCIDVEGFPGDSEGYLLLQNLQDIAMSEYLITKHSPERLEFLLRSSERYAELLQTLRRISLIRQDASFSETDVRTKLGLTGLNVLRKVLKR